MVASETTYARHNRPPAQLPVSNDAAEMSNDSLRFVLRESGEPNWDCLSRGEMLEALANRRRTKVSY